MPYTQYLECIEACNHCANECSPCAAACLREDEVKMLSHCIALDLDCTIACRTASAFMGSGSLFREGSAASAPGFAALAPRNVVVAN